jgi:molybdopterin-containing oxidoreductase family iron-sulfur binding subunit
MRSSFVDNLTSFISRQTSRNIAETGVGESCQSGQPCAEEVPLHLAALQSKWASLDEKHYWRSLEELANTEAFEEFLHREFPNQASTWKDPIGRRKFMALMAASFALAGLSGCGRQPKELIVPYVRQPEEIIPGKPLYFATAMPFGGHAKNLLVESHEGRPTKIEGNPVHPASLGSSDIFSQASILDLYDPDRSRTVEYQGEIRTWMDFVGTLRMALDRQHAKKGAGLRFLTETITSPTLANQLSQILAEFPAAKWHQYDPATSDGSRLGAKLTFGEFVSTCFHFDKADVILSLDADFLSSPVYPLCYTRQFAAKRRPSPADLTMNRLYVVETTPSLTGLAADHRLAVRASEVEATARAIALAMGIELGMRADPGMPAPRQAWIDALVRDLEKHEGRSLIIAGEQQSPLVHALAHAMNHALGNFGTSVTYTTSVEAKPINQMDSIRELAIGMESGLVDLLVMIGVNPVYSFPADLNFRERLGKVGLRVHLGHYRDETAEWCHWHIPQTHYLEAWSDVRAFDGTISIIQPLLAPLYNSKSAHELLAAFSNQPNQTGHDILQAYWKTQWNASDFEKQWRTILHDGLMVDSALPVKTVSYKPNWEALNATASPLAPGSLEIQFKPDPCIYDGSYANNSWLQELPKPISKLTWDNAALISQIGRAHV